MIVWSIIIWRFKGNYNKKVIYKNNYLELKAFFHITIIKYLLCALYKYFYKKLKFHLIMHFF